MHRTARFHVTDAVRVAVFFACEASVWRAPSRAGQCMQPVTINRCKLPNHDAETIVREWINSREHQEKQEAAVTISPFVFGGQADWGSSGGKTAPTPSYGEAEAEEEGSKSMVLTTHTIMKVDPRTYAVLLKVAIIASAGFRQIFVVYSGIKYISSTTGYVLNMER